ncbi:MAG: LacI family transcriptional regulator [Microbacteriaceae bacterium]|jgi:LacI family xylobiose transport system transcriptional regulator|nr:LacI family transcriptional regulator [Microbacteriaceae bacterium]
MYSETVARPAVSRATLSRVAADASVSISTVSKVLNGRMGVSDSTRARVEELLRDHGYNRRNSGLSVAPLIELVFDAIDSAWAIEIIQGVERISRENGMSVVLTESGDRHSPSPDWIDGVMRRRPAGVILVFSDLSADHKHQLRVRNIPFVIVDPAGDPAPDVPSIGSANWSGGYLATRHLIDLGHRRIATITGPDDMMCSTARLSGYRAALEAAGIKSRDDYIVGGEFHHEDGIVRGRELLSLPDPPTAIFAGSDLQALGVYEAARAMGVSIPDDLSVVGYDDLKIALWAGPPLTTVRQPLTEMAEEATRLVIRLRNDTQVDNLRIDLATSLVVRGSTAKLVTS